MGEAEENCPGLWEGAFGGLHSTLRSSWLEGNFKGKQKGPREVGAGGPQVGKSRASFTQQAALTQQGELPEEAVWPEQRVGWSPGSPDPGLGCWPSAQSPAGGNPCDPHHQEGRSVPDPSHPRGGEVLGGDAGCPRCTVAAFLDHLPEQP